MYSLIRFNKMLFNLYIYMCLICENLLDLSVAALRMGIA